MPAPLLTFDIETIPDTAALRQLHNLPAADSELPDSEVVAIAQRLQRQEKDHDFLPLYLHRVVVISCVLRKFDEADDSDEALKIFSLPHKDETSEPEAINQFFGLINKYQPQLVSWNGSGFDLPVLHYRALKYKQSATTYWQNDRDFKWNNYQNRFHERHTDLMDVLSLYQLRAAAPLNGIAQLCGLPGKIGVGGGGVWDAWQDGQLSAIRSYCETDALLTYLLYARYQHFRGHSDSEKEEAFVRTRLETFAAQPQAQAHWKIFLDAWQQAGA